MAIRLHCVRSNSVYVDVQAMPSPSPNKLDRFSSLFFEYLHDVNQTHKIMDHYKGHLLITNSIMKFLATEHVGNDVRLSRKPYLIGILFID